VARHKQPTRCPDFDGWVDLTTIRPFALIFGETMEECSQSATAILLFRDGPVAGYVLNIREHSAWRINLDGKSSWHYHKEA